MCAGRMWFRSLCVGVVLIWSSLAGAQGNWTTLYQPEVPRPLLRVGAAGPRTAWVALGSDYVCHPPFATRFAFLRLEDEGGSQRLIEWPNQLGDVPFFRTLCVLDSEHLWVAGDRFCCRTFDGGTTWEATNPTELGGFDFASVSFADTSCGVAVGFLPGEVHPFLGWTEDGGTTWDFQQLTSLVLADAVVALDESTAVVVGAAEGQAGVILRADRGRGVTGEQRWPEYVARIVRCSARLLYAVTRKGTVLRSRDGGVTWEELSTVPGAHGVGGFAFADSLHGLLASGFHIFYSVDGGVTWSRSGMFFREGLRDLAFPDVRDAWAISSGQIWRSTDGGRTWQPYLERPRVLFQAITFATAQRGIASGTYLFRTEDGGASWSRVDTLGGPLAMMTPQDGFLLDRQFGLLHTHDGGRTWTVVDTSFRGNDGIYAHPAGLAVTWRYDPERRSSLIQWSLDGGASWERSEWVDSEVRGFFFLNARFGWAYGAHVAPDGEKTPMIWWSADGGDHWTPAEPPAGRWKARPVVDVVFVDSLRGWAVDYASKVWFSSDGGATWELQLERADSWFSGLVALDTNEVWVYGQGVLRTENGGKDWQPFGPEFVQNAFLTSAYFPNHDLGFFAGESVILRWSRSSGVQQPRAAPGARRSRLVCHPNPFNAAVRIVFEGDHSGPVNVSVFDLQGRLVRRLFEGESGNGRLILTWNARDESGRRVPSGVYVCRVKVDGSVLTRKLALLK